MDATNIKKRTGLKVVSIIIYVLITIYLLFGLLDALKSEKNVSAALAVFFVFGVLILGMIFNALALVPAIIGLILSIIDFGRNGSVKNIISFSIISVLPILTELIFIFVCVAKT